MKQTAAILGFLIAALMLVGCGSAGQASGDTTDAVKQVEASSDKGGNPPNPNLPPPMGASPGGGAKTGKFRPAGGG